MLALEALVPPEAAAPPFEGRLSGDAVAAAVVVVVVVVVSGAVDAVEGAVELARLECALEPPPFPDPPHAVIPTNSSVLARSAQIVVIDLFRPLGTALRPSMTLLPFA